uniref:Uncharacterized protein n=1 Tax=Mycobacterium riyadhense TaxID=486698 RepID=A0A653F1R3_9MYCO|nr:hypothetical protein BIN_B_05213 [Mycobacterium riyadhense]
MRCGLRPNSFHTSATVLFDTPAARAIVRVLQCVWPGGWDPLVSATIFSIVASGMEGLRPRPCRTCPNLTRPSSLNRVRQFATVAGDTDTLAAIAALATPSAAINKALARTTSRCAPDCDRANDSNILRCPSVTTKAGTGLLIPEIIADNCQLFAGHTTRSSAKRPESATPRIGSTSTPSDIIPVASALMLNALKTPSMRRMRDSGCRPVAVRIPAPARATALPVAIRRRQPQPSR